MYQDAGRRAGVTLLMEHGVLDLAALLRRQPTCRPLIRSTGFLSVRRWIPSSETRPYWRVFARSWSTPTRMRRSTVLSGMRPGLSPPTFDRWRTSRAFLSVTKEDLRAAQIEHPPFGNYLCIPDSEIQSVHGTSGTTGRPTAFAIGRTDWPRIAESHARVMWGMGIRPGDMVFIGAVFSLYMGSWAVLAGAERLGAQAFPFGAGAQGQTRRAVNWLQQMQPAALYGTPSYALRIAEVAEEMGVDPREFGIRILFFSGEPGASIPSMKRKLEETFGAKVFDSGSMGEMTPWMNLGETTVAKWHVVLAGHCLYRGGRSGHPSSPALRRGRNSCLHSPGANQPTDDPAAVRRPDPLGGRPHAVRAHLSLPAQGYLRTDRRPVHHSG